METAGAAMPAEAPGQRIPGLAAKRAPFWARALYRLQRRRYGAVLEPTRVWARAPRPMLGFLHFVSAVDRRGSPIPPELRSLVMVKVSQINRCSFCVDLNSSHLQRRGASTEKVLALASYASSPLFSTNERAALDFAVEMTRPEGVSDAVFTRLQGCFGDDEIVELTALIALQNASSKFNAALSIPAQGLCLVPAPSSRG